jgi:hypothetical protein
MDWINQIAKLLLQLWGLLMIGGIAWIILKSILEWLKTPRLHLLSSAPRQAVSIAQPTASGSNSVPPTFHVVGVSHANRDGSSRQNMLSMLGHGDTLWMEREPSNPHDPNALRVMSQYGQIGYAPRQLAATLKGFPESSMHVELHSKGRTGNGLWGCQVRLALDAPTTRDALTETDEKTRTTPHTQAESPVILQAGPDDRVYFDAIFLAALNNGLSDILAPEDDLRVCHRSLGQGQVISARTRQGREALFEISFADNPDGSGDYSAGTFASDFFRGETLLASIKKEASEKYRQCFSTARLEHIDEARAGMYLNSNTTKLSSSRGSSFDPDTYWWDDEDEEQLRLTQEDARREVVDGGFDWHDYHKHD